MSDEEQVKMMVVDRPTEVGVKINNILTALVLGVMSWVGLNINHMKDDIADMRTDTRVQQNELKHVNKTLTNHIKMHVWRDKK